MRHEQQSFELIAAFLNGSTVNVTIDGRPQRYTGAYTTEDFLRILGVAPIMGRDFTAGDNKPGAEKVAIVGYGIWQRDFGGTSDIVGKAVRINGKPATIIGVMPPGFAFPINEELWLPLYSEYPPVPRNDTTRVPPAVLALIIALLSWFGLARLVRAETLSIKQREYIEAAHALGIGDLAIIRRHILPNILHIIIVWATVAVPNFILIEAVLSFLGLGVQPPTPSWGNMLTNATQYFYKSVGLVFIPGFFITITVLAFSIIGDAMRDALDPRLNN